MARTHTPLSSFGAELQATLRAGANRHLRITFPKRALAVRFKQRIHALRKAMKEANHPDWQNLYRCGVTEDPTDPNTILIGPKDSEFRDILTKAGVSIDSEAPTLTEVTITDTEPGSVDSFLADITDATSVQRALDEATNEEGPEPDVSQL